MFNLDADVVDVMCLVEHDDALALHRLGDELRDLGVEQVLVVVHHHVGERDDVPSQEVWAPALRLAQLFDLLERVHALASRDRDSPAPL